MSFRKPRFGEQRTTRDDRTNKVWVSTYTGRGWIQKLVWDHQVKSTKREDKEWVYNNCGERMMKVLV